MPTLAKERLELAKADRHIVDGERRVTEQRARIERLTDKGQDTYRSEALLQAMQTTLDTWRVHRALILHAIAEAEERMQRGMP
jgi:predicted  nucleic acid-binding Zn-ribbon protein